jgi:hypothetical protein
VSGVTAQLDVFATGGKSLADRYREWRATELGTDFFRAVERAALDQRDNGATRIEVNLLWAAVRSARHQRANNSWRAFVADELCALHPELGQLIERRKRTAA